MKKEDYSKYYIQGSDHYLIPRDIFEELFNEMTNWKKESSQLKGVIEEVKTAVDYMIGNVDISEIHGTKLKQILDKEGDDN